MKINILKVILILMFIINITIDISSAAATLKISNNTVVIGQSFNITIYIDSQNNSLAGLQSNFKYNHLVIRVNNITEGSLLSRFSTFFYRGIIENGTIKNTFNVIIGAHNETLPGIYVIINATAIDTGISYLTAENTILAFSNSTSITTLIVNGSVVVTKKEDLNKDGMINIVDLTLISQNFGTTNSVYDLNNDGIVNVSDIVLVAQQIT